MIAFWILHFWCKFSKILFNILLLIKCTVDWEIKIVLCGIKTRVAVLLLCYVIATKFKH